VLGGHVSVKEAVLPFNRFPEADTLLGPEMRSTGEVMGVDTTFGLAFAKSQAAAGDPLPAGGTVFFSLADRDKPAGVAVARRFVQLGFRVVATSGTAQYFEADGVPVDTVVAKVSAVGEPPVRSAQEGAGGGAVVGAAAVAGAPGTTARDGEGVGAGVDAVALIRDGKVDLVVNTPRGRGPRADGAYIRRAANQHRVACLTTVAAARAAVAGIADRASSPLEVRSLQEYHAAEQEQLPLS
jgi:carbamoyl-phosphate synthase large subunit